MVSPTIDDGVPKKSGGACGGVLNFFGAIAVVVSGLDGVKTGEKEILEDKGLMWAKIDDVLQAKRAGKARMKAMARKKTKEAKETVARRKRARLTSKKTMKRVEVEATVYLWSNGGDVISERIRG